MITLNQINERVKKVNEPLVYMFFRTSTGKRGNILFQNGRYFYLLKNKKLLLLNPLRDVEPWFNKVYNKEWKLEGTGTLLERIPVTRRNVVTMDDVKDEINIVFGNIAN